MDKSPDAFRTISEVSGVLETPAHVLRFWESRFPQIRPVKRAGGRRYYRPSDIALLFGIKRLLHDEGITIRGVQKILREQGVRHVAGLKDEVLADEGDLEMSFDCPPKDEILTSAASISIGPAQAEMPLDPKDRQGVLPFSSAPRQTDVGPDKSVDAPAPRRAVQDGNNAGFASRIRALPRGSLTAAMVPLVDITHRLTWLRDRLATRAAGGAD